MGQEGDDFMGQGRDERQFAQELLESWGDAKNERSLRDPMYRDIVTYVMPGLSAWDNTLSDRPPVRKSIWDATAVMSNRRMGNGLMGFNASPAIRWFVLGLFDKWGSPVRANDIPGASWWLRKVEDTIYQILASSNYYDQGADVNALAGAFGTPTIWASTPRFNGDRWAFSTLHPKNVWIQENERKVVDTHFRQVVLKGRQLLKAFPDVETTLPKVWKQWTNARATMFRIVHYTGPNEDFDPNNVFSKTRKKFRSCYLTLDGELLENGGMDFSGYLTWRWQTTSDQVYSESIAMDAMTPIKVAQQMRKTLIETAQLATQGPIQAPIGMKNRINLNPNGVNYYDKPDQRIYGIDMGSRNYPITDEAYKAVVRNIEDFFYGDLWLMLERQSASSRMTAYEVSQRLGEKSAVLGPVMARKQSEFDDPLISMIFNVEMNAGRLPPMPPALKSMGGFKLVPHYVGPLSIAQKRNGILEGLSTALQVMTPILQVRNEVMDNIDFDKWTRLVLETSGAPGEVVNDMQSLQAIRQARVKQQQAQQQAQMQMEMMKNYKGLAQGPDQGSPGYALAQSLGITQPEQAGAMSGASTGGR